MDKMKPCPFCGCLAQDIHKTTLLYFVQCGGCDARSQFGDTEDQAIKFWNERHDLKVGR